MDVLRRCSHPKTLTVPSATGNIKFPPLIGVNTSFALSLRAWNSDASISSNSSMSATIMSPFQILTACNACPNYIFLARILGRIDAVQIGLSQKQGDIRLLLQTVLLVRQRAFRTAFQMVSSDQTRDLECFADSSSIPWNPPTIHYPDLIATNRRCPFFHSGHCCLSNPICF